MVVKRLYQCTEIGQYDATTYYGWFDSDAEAISAFQTKVNSDEYGDAEDGYVIERVETFEGVQNTLKTTTVTTIRWRTVRLRGVNK